MKNKLQSPFCLSIAILFSLASSASWAANPNSGNNQNNTPSANSNSVNNNFVTLQAEGSTIVWAIHPSVHYQSITLTLSSAGESWTTTSIDEPVAESLVDGGYQYELVVAPALGPSVRGELKAARQAADGQEAAAAVRALKSQGKIPKHRQVQSGYFTILNGQLVSADDVE